MPLNQAFCCLFRDLLELNDEKAVAYMCMVIYTCLDTEKTEQLGVDPIKLKVALKITELCRTLPDIDWTYVVFSRSGYLICGPAVRQKNGNLYNCDKVRVIWVCRVLIVTQHFFKSSELTEKMYSEMSDHER